MIDTNIEDLNILTEAAELLEAGSKAFREHFAYTAPELITEDGHRALAISVAQVELLYSGTRYMLETPGDCERLMEPLVNFAKAVLGRE